MIDATAGFPLERASPRALPARASAPRMIADALRAGIVDGSLAPGTPLRQDALARRFAVSAIPVREALRQLESEGWVTVEMHKGATVARLSADEAREIYEIRSALESLAIGLAIPLHTDATLAAADALRRATEDETEPSRYVAGNEAFHLSLYAPAGRAQLTALIGMLHRRGERYLRLKFDLPSRKRDSDAEHAALLATVRRRDIPAAQALLRSHLLDTGELVHRFLVERAHAGTTAATGTHPAGPLPRS